MNIEALIVNGSLGRRAAIPAILQRFTYKCNYYVFEKLESREFFFPFFLALSPLSNSFFIKFRANAGKSL